MKLLLSLLASILFLSPIIAEEVVKSQVPFKEVALVIPYSAPSDGFLSLALYNDRGQLVRSLLYAKPVKAGDGSIAWDGTSDLGVPQPAGNYSTKAIFFKEKPKLEYVMTLGKNGNPPYRTPDGKGDWGGNLGGPAAICSNSDSVMMVWGCVEDNQVTGKTIGFDASVGIANQAGDQRERAAHWAGLSEGKVVDRPGSSELLPHTWGTMTFAPAAK